MRWNYGSRNEKSARSLVVGSCMCQDSGIPIIEPPPSIQPGQLESSSSRTRDEASQDILELIRAEIGGKTKRVSWIPTNLPSKQRLIYTLPQRSATKKQKELIRSSNPTRFPNESSRSITAGPKTAWANPVTLTVPSAGLIMWSWKRLRSMNRHVSCVNHGLKATKKKLLLKKGKKKQTEADGPSNPSPNTSRVHAESDGAY
jgi:hypothetical protein